jgi:3-deoxy-7-phosphoheptulonate synthase
MNLVKGYNKHFKIDKFDQGNNLLIIAGPCSIESEEQLLEVAKRLLEMNVYYMRSAFYKPRTSPYSFQGLGEAGLEIIKKVKSECDIKIVSEIVNVNDLDLYKDYVDIIQIGARNMQNFELLKAIGKINKPVLLKRGFGNTIEEWLNAAEYIMVNGNDQIILCERGIKTFENSTRNTLDISSIPVVKGITKLPIIVDPSHASGRRDLIKPLSLAAIAAGSDGLMVEVHPNPNDSISDSDQAISFDEFLEIMNKVEIIYKDIK